ncbi:hypothetical protein [Paracoccus sp. S3-43]|uniref:hypothetical protein n=1 Tax=Paracoccus sp. S3-43 TaxID=3030011 RepID=UPI0023AFE0CB|nr:hypothetical protein [Paracoccus sp. S3-43]WEF25820.1 hypothetical protein PXD02_07905 [Paracoccus sp. S3-43]
MTTDTNDIRPLETAEVDSVAGGTLRRPPAATTLALGEEDGGWATTLAVGEEDGGDRRLLLDAGFHLRQGA